MKKIRALFLLAIVFAGGALVNGTATLAEGVDGLTISKNWIRATPPAASAAGGYMILSNKSDKDVTLTGVRFEGAAKSTIHEMKMDNGVMSMRELEGGVVIGAGKQVALKPGGFHLMFMGLKSQLNDGENLPVTLVFDNGGEITLQFPVLEFIKGKKMMAEKN